MKKVIVDVNLIPNPTHEHAVLFIDGDKKLTREKTDATVDSFDLIVYEFTGILANDYIVKYRQNTIEIGRFGQELPYLFAKPKGCAKVHAYSRFKQIAHKDDTAVLEIPSSFLDKYIEQFNKGEVIVRAEIEAEEVKLGDYQVSSVFALLLSSFANQYEKPQYSHCAIPFSNFIKFTGELKTKPIDEMLKMKQEADALKPQLSKKQVKELAFQSVQHLRSSSSYEEFLDSYDAWFEKEYDEAKDEGY